MLALRTAVPLSILALVLALPASAATVATVDSVGDSWSISFGGNVEGTDVLGLTAEATFTVLDITDNELTLQINLSNTADGSIWESARVSAIGFNTDPTLTDAEIVSGIFSNAHVDGSFPNGFGSVDFCASDNKNNCQGGQNGGLNLGESGQVVAKLIFDDDITSVNFSNFGVRYQSLDSEQLGIQDGSGTGGERNGGPPPIPEPGAALLFGVGALVVTRTLRR